MQGLEVLRGCAEDSLEGVGEGGRGEEREGCYGVEGCGEGLVW